MALDLSGGEVRLRPGSRILLWCLADRNGMQIAGIPLWKRAVLNACRAGFERLLIVSDGAVERIRRELDGEPRLNGRSWEILPASRGWAEKIGSAGGRWVVSSDDWVVDGEFLAELAETRGEPTATSPDGPLAAEAEEILCWAESGWTPGREPATTPLPHRPTPPVYARVSRETGVAAAEEQIFQSLARNANFFARTVDRPMSRAISRQLARTSVTPNQITWFSILLGVTGSLMLLHPSYLAGAVGAFLFFASTVIDGCDGEIARLKFLETPDGAKLDLIGDNVVHAFLFPCIALRFYFADPSGPFLLLGGIALAGVILSQVAVYLAIIRQPSPRALKFFELFGNREFAYLILVLGFLGRLDWFMWVMLFGLWIFPVGLLGIWVWERSHAASQA